MAVQYGQHAKALLMQLKQSDWMPEYNTALVRNAVQEAGELGTEITATLQSMNYEIKDINVAARKSIHGTVTGLSCRHDTHTTRRCIHTRNFVCTTLCYAMMLS